MFFLPIRKEYFYFFIDFFLAFLSLPLTFFLVFPLVGGSFPPPFFLAKQTLGFGCCALGALLWTKSYSVSWRFLDVQGVSYVFRKALLSFFLFLPFVVLTRGTDHMPRQLFVVHLMVLISVSLGARLFIYLCCQRFYHPPLPQQNPGIQKKKAVLVGSNETTDFFLKYIQSKPLAAYDVVGIVDDSPPKGLLYRSIPFLGSLQDISSIIANLVIAKKEPTDLILADPKIKGARLKNFLQWIENFPFQLSYLPPLPHLLEKGALPQQEPWVEDRIPLGHMLEPLSGNDHGRLRNIKKLIQGKRLLITGAGGVIGRALLQELLHFCPHHIALMDCHEGLLQESALCFYRSDSSFAGSYTTWVGDVRDKERVFYMMAHEKPHIVFHAAGLQDEKMAQQHPTEVILTNIFGACYVADAAVAYCVENVVLAATQFETQAYSLLEAIQSITEAYYQGLDNPDESPLNNTPHHFTVVRLLPVLHDKDQAIQKIQQDIQKGGPVVLSASLKHKNYHLSPEKASHCLLDALLFQNHNPIENGLNGPLKGGVFFSSSGGMRVFEVAENLVRLAGLSPHIDIDISFYREVASGVCPEKQTFFSLEKPPVSGAASDAMPFSFLKYGLCSQKWPQEALEEDLQELKKHALKQRSQTCVKLLKQMIEKHHKPLP